MCARVGGGHIISGCKETGASAKEVFIWSSDETVDIDECLLEEDRLARDAVLAVSRSWWNTFARIVLRLLVDL